MLTHPEPNSETEKIKLRQELESAVVRLAGDSGDGMQVSGGQFTLSAALAKNNLVTFPDFPAEIRAPAGTTYGVSSFQINFGARDIKTSGDELDILVAMNPAALRVEVEDLKVGGIVILDSGTFSQRLIRKAGFEANPLEGDFLNPYRVIDLNISQLTLNAVKNFNLTKKEALRCKNFWMLGYLFWMFNHERKTTIEWLKAKFKKRSNIAEANIAALNAGHALGEVSESIDSAHGYVIPAKDNLPNGLYRTVTGSEALAWGLVAGSQLANLKMIFCSYPITPASPLLHILSKMQNQDLTTFQAEDEISAACAAIGASFGGALGVTSSSGPGIALKSEAIGLAVSTELPIVIVNTQRAGPSTGLPTKTEQSDLFQAVYGRNADNPVVVLAACSPSDCFQIAIEAVRIAIKFMTPVILLSDGFISNAAEPWLIPDIKCLKKFRVNFYKKTNGFHPFLRKEKTLARVWAIPGTPGLEHRIGGVEKHFDTGHISYDANNHQKMSETRAAKIRGVANDLPEQTIDSGPSKGSLVVVGWGSTFGPINRAVSNLQNKGRKVSHIQLRYIWPLPLNLGVLLSRFDKVLVPEMNMGQLVAILRSEYLINAKSINKVSGQPYKIRELESIILAHLDS